MATDPTNDPTYSVHECAVQAEAALEKLATELAKSGAPPAAVDAVSKQAGSIRNLVKALGAGQEQTADTAPPHPGQAMADAHEQFAAQLAAQHNPQTTQTP